jgi:GT2 family glycosyltransferase
MYITATAGGFDNRLGAGTPFPSEDIELVGRLSQMGWYGLYAPGPTVLHRHGRRYKSEAIRLMADYDRGRGAYYASIMRYPSCRMSTIKHWFQSMRQQHLHSSFREIMGAVRYLTM